MGLAPVTVWRPSAQYYVKSFAIFRDHPIQRPKCRHTNGRSLALTRWPSYRAVPVHSAELSLASDRANDRTSTHTRRPTAYTSRQLQTRIHITHVGILHVLTLCIIVTQRNSSRTCTLQRNALITCDSSHERPFKIINTLISSFITPSILYPKLKTPVPTIDCSPPSWLTSWTP